VCFMVALRGVQGPVATSDAGTSRGDVPSQVSAGQSVRPDGA
jgi:hypothetical protein